MMPGHLEKEIFRYLFQKHVMTWGKYVNFLLGGVPGKCVVRFFPDAGSSAIDGHLLRFAKRAHRRFEEDSPS